MSERPRPFVRARTIVTIYRQIETVGQYAPRELSKTGGTEIPARLPEPLAALSQRMRTWLSTYSGGHPEQRSVVRVTRLGVKRFGLHRGCTLAGRLASLNRWCPTIGLIGRRDNRSPFVDSERSEQCCDARTTTRPHQSVYVLHSSPVPSAPSGPFVATTCVSPTLAGWFGIIGSHHPRTHGYGLEPFG